MIPRRLSLVDQQFVEERAAPHLFQEGGGQQDNQMTDGTTICTLWCGRTVQQLLIGIIAWISGNNWTSSKCLCKAPYRLSFLAFSYMHNLHFYEFQRIESKKHMHIIIYIMCFFNIYIYHIDVTFKNTI